MCKTYRAYVEKAGKLVTLKQKMAANPKVEKLIGAPNLEIQVVANRALAPQYQSLSGPVYDGSHKLQTSFDQVLAESWRVFVMEDESRRSACIEDVPLHA